MAITFEEYQKLSARTANKHENEQYNYAMGLAGEAGELIDLIKKTLFHGHTIDKLIVKKEAGDVLWYTSQLMRIYNIRIVEVFKRLHIYFAGEDFKLVTDTSIMRCCLRLSETVGKVNSCIADPPLSISHRNTLFETRFFQILCDLCFLIGVAGLTIEEVAEGNIEKLKARYPKGFSVEDSINRTE